ncbi:Tad domain-containing protein [Gorillibacterium sp. sgz500922]|uniref:Tad domain-containing protein n=1 Tax=Gorillibacterium sp. sgz500922 TaxID=3446694 RepID=UPI003F6737B6
MFRPLRNDKGNVTLLTLFTLVGILFVSGIMLYFFSTHIVRRQSQNVTDSAALAAVQVLKDRYEEAMQDEASRELDRVLDEANRWIDDWIRSHSSSVPPAAPGGSPGLPAASPAGPAPSPPDPPTLEDALRELGVSSEVIALVYPRYLFRKEYDYLKVVKDPYFAFTAERNGDLLYDTYLGSSGEIQAAVRDIIARNNGTAGDRGAIWFPTDNEPKLSLTAGAELKLEKVGFDEDIYSEAGASIHSKDFPIAMSNQVPRQIPLN